MRDRRYIFDRCNFEVDDKVLVIGCLIIRESNPCQKHFIKNKNIAPTMSGSGGKLIPKPIVRSSKLIASGSVNAVSRRI